MAATVAVTDRPSGSARMDQSAVRHGSGWAIGGWFVPTSTPFATAATWERYACALTILSAILAIVVVRQISARVRAESTEA